MLLREQSRNVGAALRLLDRLKMPRLSPSHSHQAPRAGTAVVCCSVSCTYTAVCTKSLTSLSRTAQRAWPSKWYLTRKHDLCTRGKQKGAASTFSRDQGSYPPATGREKKARGGNFTVRHWSRVSKIIPSSLETFSTNPTFTSE